MPEGTQVEKKEASGSGAKGPAAKSSGAPQDSDSSATCRHGPEWTSPRGGRTGKCAGTAVSFCKRLLSITCVPRQRHETIPRLPSEGEGPSLSVLHLRIQYWDRATSMGWAPLAAASEPGLGREE